jgi:hypothetical protein
MGKIGMRRTELDASLGGTMPVLDTGDLSWGLVGKKAASRGGFVAGARSAAAAGWRS